MLTDQATEWIQRGTNRAALSDPMPDGLPIPYDGRPQRACPIIAGLQVISRWVLKAMLFRRRRGPCAFRIDKLAGIAIITTGSKTMLVAR